jgi:hypothetical protein
MKHTHTHTQILTAIQPPNGPLEVISGGIKKETHLGLTTSKNTTKRAGYVT